MLKAYKNQSSLLEEGNPRKYLENSNFNLVSSFLCDDPGFFFEHIKSWCIVCLQMDYKSSIKL